MPKDSNSSPATTPMTREQKRELLLEAARRANWDALQGPRYLRTGRFFVSQVHAAHDFEAVIGSSERRVNDGSEPAE